jgi:hypothetical protein
MFPTLNFSTSGIGIETENIVWFFIYCYLLDVVTLGGRSPLSYELRGMSGWMSTRWCCEYGCWLAARIHVTENHNHGSSGPLEYVQLELCITNFCESWMAQFAWSLYDSCSKYCPLSIIGVTLSSFWNNAIYWKCCRKGIFSFKCQLLGAKLRINNNHKFPKWRTSLD